MAFDPIFSDRAADASPLTVGIDRQATKAITSGPRTILGAFNKQEEPGAGGMLDVYE